MKKAILIPTPPSLLPTAKLDLAMIKILSEQRNEVTVDQRIAEIKNVLTEFSSNKVVVDTKTPENQFFRERRGKETTARWV